MNNPTSPEDQVAVKKPNRLLWRRAAVYDHTYRFATRVARNAVVRPVADLQLILMDTRGLDVPGCMQTAREELIDYMDAVIRAVLADGAQARDSTVRDLLDRSKTHYNNFDTEREAGNRCAPCCIR